MRKTVLLSISLAIFTTIMIVTPGYTADPTIHGRVVTLGSAPLPPADGARVELLEFPSIFTFTGSDGSYTLVVPYGIPITRKVTLAGFVPTYSSLRIFTTDFSSSLGGLELFPQSFLVSNGVQSGYGMIIGASLDLTNGTSAPITGVIVTAQSSLNPSTPYIVGIQGSNGFNVINTLDGDTITLNATKQGYSCETQIFKTFSDSVSHGPIICRAIQSTTPVGYNSQWLLITLACLTLAGGFLIKKRVKI